MDKLSSADQQKVRKMSNERLRAKLIDAGYNGADMELTVREELLNLFSDFVAQTQTRASVSEEETTAMDDNGSQQNLASGEMDLDREAFEFEKLSLIHI